MVFLNDLMDAWPADEEPVSLCKPQLQEHPRSSLSVLWSMVPDQLRWFLTRAGEELEPHSAPVENNFWCHAQGAFFAGEGCGGRTALELCALDLAPTVSQFSMLGVCPLYSTRRL